MEHPAYVLDFGKDHALLAMLPNVTAALGHGDTAATGLVQRTHIGSGCKRITSQHQPTPG